MPRDGSKRLTIAGSALAIASKRDIVGRIDIGRTVIKCGPDSRREVDVDRSGSATADVACCEAHRMDLVSRRAGSYPNFSV